MRFWDASAVAAVCVEERTTPAVRRLLTADRPMAVWWATPVEVASALARLRRMGGLGPADELLAREALAAYRRAWTEVQPTARLRERAVRLLLAHDLRAAHALQLAAAATWAGETAEGCELVCLDGRLAEAARREGFRVLPGPGGA